MVIMVARSFLVIILAILLAACSRFSHHERGVTMAPIPQSSQQFRQVAVFRGIRINGALDVSLHTGYSTPQVLLRGDPRDLAQVVTKVVNGVLFVSLGKGYPHFGRVQVDIHTRYLNAFEYHGRGLIIGKHLRTSMMSLVLDNPGKTYLRGQLGLERLVVTGGGYTELDRISGSGLSIKVSGKSRLKLGGIINLTCLELEGDSLISLYWVKARALVIRAKDNSFVQLAGVVNRLDVELWGNARFFGRYLRAKRAFVKTHNQSVAEVAAISHQHTLATDTSDIRFYHLPTMRTDFMAFEGAVLDMRDLSRPNLKMNNDFNK